MAEGQPENIMPSPILSGAEGIKNYCKKSACLDIYDKEIQNTYNYNN